MSTSRAISPRALRLSSRPWTSCATTVSWNRNLGEEAHLSSGKTFFHGVKPASFFADRLTLPEEIIFGQSEAMQAVRRTVERTSTASVPVLILGESGTGKEIISKEIHRRSPWSQGPFVKVSCPAIPGTLLESELFGYEKGAFTGAWSSKPGRVEMAHCGTLFLDE